MLSLKIRRHSYTSVLWRAISDPLLSTAVPRQRPSLCSAMSKQATLSKFFATKPSPKRVATDSAQAPSPKRVSFCPVQACPEVRCTQVRVDFNFEGEPAPFSKLERQMRARSRPTSWVAHRLLRSCRMYGSTLLVCRPTQLDACRSQQSLQLHLEKLQMNCHVQSQILLSHQRLVLSQQHRAQTHSSQYPTGLSNHLPAHPQTVKFCSACRADQDILGVLQRLTTTVCLALCSAALSH